MDLARKGTHETPSCSLNRPAFDSTPQPLTRRHSLSAPPSSVAPPATDENPLLPLTTAAPVAAADAHLAQLLDSHSLSPYLDDMSSSAPKGAIDRIFAVIGALTVHNSEVFIRNG